MWGKNHWQNEHLVVIVEVQNTSSQHNEMNHTNRVAGNSNRRWNISSLWLNTFLALRCKMRKSGWSSSGKKSRRRKTGLQRSEYKTEMGHKGRLKSTSDVKQASKQKEDRKWWRVWAFVGVDVMALWGMCLQGARGAPVWLCRGGGRIRSAVTQEEEEDGAKQGLSLIHLSLSPFFYSHRLKLPQIPLTRNPAECSQPPKRQLT